MEAIKSILYYLTVFFLVVYILMLVFLPGQLTEIIGFRGFVVTSNSMEPEINVNDLIIARSVEPEDLQEGDIITFSVYIPEVGEKAHVTHYIGEIEETDTGTIYHTRGIHLPEGMYDGWRDEFGDPYYIRFKDIEGEYVFKIPYVGNIQKLIADRIFISLIFFNGVVIYLLVKFLRRNKEEES